MGSPACSEGCLSERTTRAQRYAQTDLALDPLLLAVNGFFDRDRGARIFSHHFAERGASGLPFLERGQRLAEPQQGVGSLCRFIVFGSDPEEGLRGVPILLPLKVAFA